MEGNLGGLELRGTTKSYHTTEFTCEVYCGEMQMWPLREHGGKGEGGETLKGLAFYKGIQHLSIGRVLYLVATLSIVGYC